MATTRSQPEIALRIKRTFSAPREKVFAAWTDANALKQWFAPSDNHTTPLVEVGLRVGGRFRIQIKDPDGDLHTASGVYREIKPPEKLVFTWAWEGASGCGSQVVTGQWETVVTIEFRAVPEGTELVLTQKPFPTAEDRDSHDEGWTGCLNRLATLAEQLTDRPS